MIVNKFFSHRRPARFWKHVNNLRNFLTIQNQIVIYTIFPDEPVRIHLFQKSYNGTTEVLTENTSIELIYSR
jgi:hypothetical protein